MRGTAVDPILYATTGARIGWLRRRNKSTVKLMQYYWATIAECVPPAVILAALAVGGFKGVKRTVSNGILSEYIAHGERTPWNGN